MALCVFCGQKIWFHRRFPGTVGQVFKFVWRLCWKINVVCMSLSPFDSFHSRFVTYLLNCPRIIGELYAWRDVPTHPHRCLFSIRTKNWGECGLRHQRLEKVKWAIVEEIHEPITMFTKILHTAIRNAGYSSSIFVLGMVYKHLHSACQCFMSHTHHLRMETPGPIHPSMRTSHVLTHAIT
jgi:hypothetical protein